MTSEDPVSESRVNTDREHTKSEEDRRFSASELPEQHESPPLHSQPVPVVFTSYKSTQENNARLAEEHRKLGLLLQWAEEQTKKIYRGEAPEPLNLTQYTADIASGKDPGKTEDIILESKVKHLYGVASTTSV
eukprot:TRINITY_DN113296_c0_g1_i1.p1 TRINITY_DN113296_c0_g1~~TRINITY_DN113296_c0_g1_i1.p1  ORF type:complete len:133 (-),score=22.81 TRINITY_DN113296_c0_g1_i1:122-520(-)